MNVIQARAELIRAAIQCLAAEHAEESADADAQAEYSDERLAIAARDLTNATDDLPPAERPIGWETTPDGRTA